MNLALYLPLKKKKEGGFQICNPQLGSGIASSFITCRKGRGLG